MCVMGEAGLWLPQAFCPGAGGGIYTRSVSSCVPQGPTLQPITCAHSLWGLGSLPGLYTPGMGAWAGAEESASTILGCESQAALTGVPLPFASSSTWRPPPRNRRETKPRTTKSPVFTVGSHLGPPRTRSTPSPPAGGNWVEGSLILPSSGSGLLCLSYSP